MVQGEAFGLGHQPAEGERCGGRRHRLRRGGCEYGCHEQRGHDEPNQPPHHFATITSDALMIAATASPGLSARSSTASLVIDAVTITPLPMSMRTWAVVWPFRASITRPFN